MRRQRSPESLEQAKGLIDQALAIDPEYPDAWSSLGYIANIYDGDQAASARHQSKALELDPLNHDDPRWIEFLESQGKSPEQLGAIEFKVSAPAQAH